MKIQASRRERFQYWLDNQFSQGTITLIKWLAILSFGLITLAAIILSIFKISQPGEEKFGFFEAFWRSMMRTLDAGTMGADEGFWFRIVMFGVTLGGIFIISTLIGILTTGVEGKLEALRKGRSRVLESNHIILLGWSEQIFILLDELMKANSNVPNAVMVILGEEEKQVMEETIRERIEFLGKTRIVCRSGSPLELSDLDMVSINTSRSIIVLSPGGEDADNLVIKTVLAVTNHPRRDPAHKLNVVAEIYDPRNMEAAQIVGTGEVEWIEVGNFVARIIAQTCRQSCLSVVYTELLDFGGDEIYFHTQPELVGKTFAEALMMYPKNAVMGVCPKNGDSQLNPAMDFVLQTDDQLILMASDDDEINYHPESRSVQTDLISINTLSNVQPESALILGWNRRGASIITELNSYAPSGSKVLIVADSEETTEQINACCPELENLTITLQKGDTTSRSLLNGLNLKQFDHIILLCYSDTLDVQQADARTLITLLHLRDIAIKSNCHFPIVSEMLDVRNRNLADITRADDFIVSDRLVSLMMSQIAENPRLNLVFQDLFDPEGCEIYLKPVTNFVKTGVPVNFYTIIEAASRQNSVALGYRLHTQVADGGMMYGIHLNPLKTENIVFSPEDRIIVLAED